MRQTNLRELLKFKDQESFDRTFEVVTLDTVISEIKDEKSRQYVEHGLPFTLDVKTASTFIEKPDMV